MLILLIVYLLWSLSLCPYVGTGFEKRVF